MRSNNNILAWKYHQAQARIQSRWLSQQREACCRSCRVNVRFFNKLIKPRNADVKLDFSDFKATFFEKEIWYLMFSSFVMTPIKRQVVVTIENISWNSHWQLGAELDTRYGQLSNGLRLRASRCLRSQCWEGTGMQQQQEAGGYPPELKKPHSTIAKLSWSLGNSYLALSLSLLLPWSGHVQIKLPFWVYLLGCCVQSSDTHHKAEQMGSALRQGCLCLCSHPEAAVVQ